MNGQIGQEIVVMLFFFETALECTKVFEYNPLFYDEKAANNVTVLKYTGIS